MSENRMGDFLTHTVHVHASASLVRSVTRLLQRFADNVSVIGV